MIPQFLVLIGLGIAAVVVMVIAWFGALVLGRLPGWLNRAAVLFRLILYIPAGLMTTFLVLGWEILALFFWVTVLILGRTPRPGAGVGRVPGCARASLGVRSVGR